MQCDLDFYYGNLLELIPTKLDEEFIFSSSIPPIPPVQIKTDQIVIQKAIHEYNSWFRVDMLHFRINKRTARQLGLFVLSVLFHPMPIHIQLNLSNKSSDIKCLIVEFDHRWSFGRYTGYNTRPDRFSYSPRDMAQHPWYEDNPSPNDLPCFWLTNEQDMVVRDEEWNNRDTIRGLGSDEGSIRFADLLLNAGRSENQVQEYVLEGDGGFRGVGKLSAEVKLVIIED